MVKKVLVIGAGIVGASVAWHLVRAGCAVTILDAGSGGGLATRDSFAWINASWGNPEFYFHFRRRSMAAWHRLAGEVGGLSVDWCGSLMWDLSPAEREAYARQHGSWGYGLRRVDRAQALAIEPNLKAPPDEALHIAEEGMVEPVDAARALLADAVARGAWLMENAEVAVLAVRDGRIAGVVTEAGEAIEADETVVAAGTATPHLLATAGLHLAMTTPAGLIMHSAVVEKRLLNGLVLTPEFHARQTREGRIIAASDFAGGDPRGKDEEMARDLVAKVRHAIAGAEDLELGFVTVGYRPTPTDGFPAVGRLRDGLYVAVMHSGVTLAPLVGELAAREIAGGDRDPDLAPYDPGRAALA